MDVVMWDAMDSATDASDSAVNDVAQETLTPSDAMTTAPVQRKRLAVGDSFTCLAGGGVVRCCGVGREGQLGNGSFSTTSLSPVMVNTLTNAAAIVAGRAHACALTEDNRVACWGSNSSGQIGNGSYGGMLSSPVFVGANRVAVSARRDHSCAISGPPASVHTTCWGTVSGTWSFATPTIVSELAGASAVASGPYHTCAIRSGSVFCWGDNRQGQVGPGAPRRDGVRMPTQVSGLSGAVELALGYRHTCARLMDGTVRCWGENSDGQLGDGTTMTTSTLVTVDGLSNAVELVAGDWHTCARRSDGTVWCWGRRGFIGDDTMGRDARRAAPVPGLSDVVEIAASAPTTSQGATCALRSDATVWCWGYNGGSICGAAGSGSAQRPVRLPF